MITVVAVVVLVGMPLPMPGVHVPPGIQTVIYIDRGMRAPVSMALFPSMETRQPD